MKTWIALFALAAGAATMADDRTVEVSPDGKISVTYTIDANRMADSMGVSQLSDSTIAKVVRIYFDSLQKTEGQK